MKKENRHVSWSLLAKDVSGELSPREHEELQKELVKNPDIEKQVKELWGETYYAQEINMIDVDSAWINVKAKFSNTQTKYKIIRLYRYVAIVVMLMLLLTSTFLLRNYFSEPAVIKICSTGTIKMIQLPDGTRVDLNVGSTLTYPEVFDGDSRIVSLAGEAFFDVVRNETKSFIIETEELNVEVLGTAFNVKAYAGATNSEVTVSTGKVNVGSKATSDNIILEAGDAVAYNKSIHSLKKIKVLTPNYKAWKTKEIEFKNTSLSDVFRTIEEVYHISIVIDRSLDIDDDVLNATFSHHSLNHVLESVCTSFNLKYQQVNNEYLISAQF